MKPPVRVVSGFAAALLLITGLGLWYFRAQQNLIRRDVEADLEAIAYLKAGQIGQWLDERRADAAILASSPFFADALRRWQAAPEAALFTQLTERLEAHRSQRHYRDVLVAGVDGTVQISATGSKEPLAPEARAPVSAAAQAQHAVLGELHLAGPGRFEISIASPVLADDAAGSTVCGVVVLQVDPGQFLFPLIQAWPTASDTAETLLLRKDGDSIVYLNELRHEHGTALSKRVPLSRSIVGAQAARGATGILHGRDYRDVPVVAAAQAIPGTSWILVSKIDASEAYAGAQYSAVMISLIFLAAIVTIVLAATFFVQRNAARHYRRLFQSESALHARDEQYRLLFDNFTLGICICDVVIEGHHAVDLIIRRVNVAYEAQSGLSAQSVIGRRITEVVPPEEMRPMLDRYGSVALSGASERFEAFVPALHRHFDIAAHRVGGHQIGILFQDITERKRTETLLLESDEKFRQLADNITDVFWITSPDLQRIHYASPAYEHVWGRTLDELYANPSAWSDAVFEEDRERTFVDIMKLCVGAASINTEFRIKRPDGAIRWIHSRGYPVRDQDGALLRITGIDSDITDRKRIEDDLKLFRTLMDQSNDALEVVDPETAQFVDANETAHSALGYTREEFLKLRVFDIDPKVKEEDFARIVAELKRTGTSFIQGMHRCKDGTEYPVEVNIRMAHLDRDYVVAIARDITERVRAEESLRLNEAHYRTLVESLPQNIFIKDLDSRYVSANENYARDLGISAAEIEGKDDFAFFPRELADKYRRDDKYIMESGNTEVFEEQFIKEGKPTWIETVKCPVRDEQGRVIGVLGSFRDITTRKRNEEKMHLQGAALNAAANAIVITDSRGMIEWINTAFSALTGYTAEEAIGKNPRDLVKSGVHDPEFYRGLWTTILRGEVWTGELTNRRKDGSLYTETQTITPLRDADGRIAHFIGIKQDVSARKELEKQLQQAQKMEAVGRLAGGVAHDFNNLLSVILGYSEMALDEAAPESPQRQQIAEVLKAGQRAANLTRQLLAFARQQTITPQVMRLNTAIEGMLKMLGRLIGEDIDLLWKPSKDLWPVKMDPTQVDQVLANLVVNSRDAITDVGKITIETVNVELDDAYCELHAGTRPGRYVLLAVSDDGCGMSAETMAQVFEPFFTTKEQGKGTGLGLATVYGSVKQNGGFINVYSELGHGTTFKIYIPRHETISQDEDAQRTAAMLRGGTETILLVEDEESLLRMAEQILGGLGYTVLPALGPQAALEVAVAHKERIDLLLTDVIMPEMNGRELSQRIGDLRPGIKTLFMSGYTADAIAHRGVLEAGTHFMHKPFSKETIAAKVREALDA